jgi:hypothetical protein
MRIRPVPFGLFVLIVFLAPVVIAQATGTWATTGRAAAGADAGGARVGSGGGDGSGGGGGRVAEPGDARGWMTLTEVAEANAVDVAEIIAAFNLPPTIDPGTRLSELESDLFSVEALRTWLATRSDP